MRASALTDRGLVRPDNEDSILMEEGPIGPLPALYLVADGMGGRQGGAYASRFVVQKMREELQQMGEGTDIKSAMLNALQKVNAALYREASDREDLKGMGTTVVMAVPEGKTVHIVNVGDSRLYHFNGTLTQVTRDHSWVEEMVARGVLTRDDPLYQSKKNVLTRAVGVEASVTADYFMLQTEPGDRLLLCSDGLYNMVGEARMAEVLAKKDSPSKTAEKLVKLGNQEGGKDNISVIVLKVEK